MSAAKKKPDLALVIGVGDKGKPKDEEEMDGEGDDEGGAYTDAFHELAMALGVDPAKVDADKGVEAMKVMHDLCAAGEHEEEAEEK